MTLRTRLESNEILIVPGVFDTLSAYRAECAGFEAVFVSGSALAATQLARPDIGLLTITETADIVARIADRIGIHIMVDADQGFGNAYNVSRTVKMLERAGASAVQLEDQVEVKAASAPLSRPVIKTIEMMDKIKAAKDSLSDNQIIVSARTDAMSTEGFNSALARASQYLEAGADMIFVENLTKRSQMEELSRQLGEKVPLLHNLLRPDDEVTDAAIVQEIGYSVALFPGVALAAVGNALDESLESLAQKPVLSKTSKRNDRIGAAGYLKTRQDKLS